MAQARPPAEKVEGCFEFTVSDWQRIEKCLECVSVMLDKNLNKAHLRAAAELQGLIVKYILQDETEAMPIRPADPKSS